ncbi:hypothetical protein CCYA_CCYA12G3275 [Cyanidiococcus yangmingshanensis]|nr:hypothetical protein CCYA_CCYA12G3275 [Cyanidiococcus yangmingshanensis]
MVLEPEGKVGEPQTALEFKRRREASRAFLSERNQRQAGTQTSGPVEHRSDLRQDASQDLTNVDWEEQVSFACTNQSSFVEESLAQIDASFLAENSSQGDETPLGSTGQGLSAKSDGFQSTVTEHIPVDWGVRQRLRLELSFLRVEAFLKWVQIARRLWSLLPLVHDEQTTGCRQDATSFLARAITCYRYPVVEAGSENKRVWSHIGRYAAPHRALHADASKSRGSFLTPWEQSDGALYRKLSTNAVGVPATGADLERRRRTLLSAKLCATLQNDLAGWQLAHSEAHNRKQVEWWQQRVHEWQQAFLSLFQQYRRRGPRRSAAAMPSSTGFHVLGDHYAACFGWVSASALASGLDKSRGLRTRIATETDVGSRASSCGEDQNALIPYALLSHSTERIRELLCEEFGVVLDELSIHRRPDTETQSLHDRDGVGERRLPIGRVERAAGPGTAQLVIRGGNAVQGFFEFLLHFGPWLFSSKDVPLLLAPSHLPFAGACLTMAACEILGCERSQAPERALGQPSDGRGASDSSSHCSLKLQFTGPLSPFATPCWETFLIRSGAFAARIDAELDSRTQLDPSFPIGPAISGREHGAADTTTRTPSPVHGAWQTLEAWIPAMEADPPLDAHLDGTTSSPSDQKWCFRPDPGQHRH